MKTIYRLVLIIFILLGIGLRFYQLGQIPVGLHADEASQGYNAYSLLETGKDMYGLPYPILFRANGSYQPPVYTYLSIIPIYFLGNTAFSIRLVSAIAGGLVVALTFLILYQFGIGNREQRIDQGLLSAVVLSLSPWAIHYSKMALEGNLVLVFFLIAILAFLHSFKYKKLLIVAFSVFGLSTHVYYSERITVFLYIPLLLYVFRNSFLRTKKLIVLASVIFIIALVPHILIARSGALTKRFSQVSLFSGSQQGSTITNLFAKTITKYFDHYFLYFSPNNLFMNPQNDLGKITTDLTVFYPWFFPFLLIGLSFLLNNSKESISKVLAITAVVAPVPAALTGDLLYPLRALTLMWCLSVVISYGFYYFWIKVKQRLLWFLLLCGILSYSVAVFFVSYFVIFKYININDMGYPYIRLIDKLSEYKNNKIIIDTSPRSWGVGVRMAYLMKADPIATQKNLSSQLKTPYYYGSVNEAEIFTIDNIQVKPLSWLEVCGKDLVIIGDRYSVSETQILEHRLKMDFTIDDITHAPALFAYSPSRSCVK